MIGSSPIYSTDISKIILFRKIWKDAVLRENGEADADSLTEITHKEDGLWASTVKENNLSFEDNQKSDIKVDLISLIDKESEICQDYIEAFDNLCFAASLNN